MTGGEPEKPSTEVRNLRERCRELEYMNKDLIESEKEAKQANIAMESDIISLKKRLKAAEDKLVRGSAFGAIAQTDAEMQHSKTVELKTKLEGAKEECGELKKDNEKLTMLYKEAKALYAEENRRGILKKNQGKRQIKDQLHEILGPKQYVLPSTKSLLLAATNLKEKLKNTKTSVMKSLDKLGEEYVMMKVKVRKEEAPMKTVEFRQTYATLPDGSLSLISSVPVIKVEKDEVITID